MLLTEYALWYTHTYKCINSKDKIANVICFPSIIDFILKNSIYYVRHRNIKKYHDHRKMEDVHILWQTFATARRKLHRSHGVYIILISIKFQNDLTIFVRLSVCLHNVCGKHSVGRKNAEIVFKFVTKSGRPCLRVYQEVRVR